MKSIKISAIIMSLMMVCCLCLSCLEGSAGGSPTDSLGGDPTISASEREDSGSDEQDSSASGSESETSGEKDSANDSGKEDETGGCVHDLERKEVTATCTTVGGTIEICKKNCGYKKVYNKVLPLGHRIDEEGVCAWCKKAENEIEWYEFRFHWAVGDDSKVETFKLDKQTEDIDEVLENKAWEITWKHREESPSLNWTIVDEWFVDRSAAISFKGWNGGTFDYYKHMGNPGCAFDNTNEENHPFETTVSHPGHPHCTEVGYESRRCSSCGYEEYVQDIPACGHEYINEGGEEVCQWCRKTRTEIENKGV
ncbi:MAG: hypothetical protein SOT09_06490 [Candidatus Borkfalkiaceae bacterium]|nr:hypothetical protein [Christensenellaceae bacterium]